MKSGKISRAELSRYVLSKLSKRRTESLLDSGSDCAVINSDKPVFFSVDPITGAATPEVIGALSVIISSNDVAAGGAEPIAVLLTLLLPADSPSDTVERIMQSAEATAKHLNIEIAGGHTERTDAVTRPVVCATAAGLAARVLKNAPKADDYILMTKSAALEGTFILASEHEERLGLSAAELDTAKGYLGQLSVIEEGKILSAANISAMHDVTEGGILGAVFEVVSSAGLGAEIDSEAILVSDITKKICGRLSLNPHLLLGSGSMVFTVCDFEPVLRSLNAAGIPAAVIGRVTSTSGLRANVCGKIRIIEDFTDEINKV